MIRWPLLGPRCRPLERIRTGIEIQVVWIAHLDAVVRILRRFDANAAGHPHDVADADLSARIVLPFRDGRVLMQRIRTLLDQHTHQNAGEGFAHGPAFERRMHINTDAIGFRDDLPLVCDEEAEGFAGFAHGYPSRLTQDIGADDGFGVGQYITKWPGRRCWIGHSRFDHGRCEMDAVVIQRMRNTALTAIPCCGAHDAVVEGQRNPLCGSIDVAGHDFLTGIKGGGKAAYVGHRIVFFQARDEQSRAQHLGEPAGVMSQCFTRRRYPARV